MNSFRGNNFYVTTQETNKLEYDSSAVTSNDDTNFNSSAESEHLETIQTVAHISANILGICAIILNIGFIFAMCHAKDASIAYHRFMKVLSVADILASFAFLITLNYPQGPLSNIYPQNNFFLLSDGLPYIFRGFPWVFFTAYFLTLTCLSVNQYVAVCRPWKYSYLASPKMVWCCIIAVWIVSSLQVIVPTIVLFILNSFEDKEVAKNQLYQISRIEMQVWMCVFILSTFINITLNSLMYKKIRELKWKRRLSMNSQETLNIRMKQEAFVTICLLLVTAILLRLPFPIVSIISLEFAAARIDTTVNVVISALVILLLYTNFFADPIIYIVRMREAREFIKSSSQACVRTCLRQEHDEHQDANFQLIQDREKTENTSINIETTKKNNGNNFTSIPVSNQTTMM